MAYLHTHKSKTLASSLLAIPRTSSEITQSLLRLSLTTTNAGAFLWDPKKKVFSCDKTFLSLIGINTAQVVCLDDFISQIIPTDRALVQLVFNNESVSKKDIPLVFRILQSNGEIRTISGRAESLTNKSGETFALTGVCNDITDSIKLKVKADEIELLKEREELIALMVHDLRNPLIGIKRIMTALIEGKSLDPSISKERLFNMVQCATQSMLNMIENVLESYRLEHEGIKLQSTFVDLKDLANECLIELEPISNSKSIKLSNFIPQNLNVIADRIALKRVLCNLLSNAIKFTPLQGEIILKAFAQKDSVSLQVIDNGFGIPTERLEKLFNRFWQSNHRNRADGLGMGLYLCKKLVESQNGTISCSSITDGGTTFEITLPQQILSTDTQLKEISSGEYFSINKMRKSLSSIDSTNSLKQMQKTAQITKLSKFELH